MVICGSPNYCGYPKNSNFCPKESNTLSKIILYLCHALEGVAETVLQPSIGIEVYELDYSNCRRALRSRLHLLSRTCKRRCRDRMVWVDRRFYCFLCFEYDVAGQSDPDNTIGHSLPSLDRDRCHWHCTDWHLCFQRAIHILEIVLHHYFDHLRRRAESYFVKIFCQILYCRICQ